MPERVVVRLEPVEVEDADRHGLPVRRRGKPGHVGEQLPAVAEPGEGIGRGVHVGATAIPAEWKNAIEKATSRKRMATAVPIVATVRDRDASAP